MGSTHVKMRRLENVGAIDQMQRESDPSWPAKATVVATIPVGKRPWGVVLDDWRPLLLQQTVLRLFLTTCRGFSKMPATLLEIFVHCRWRLQPYSGKMQCADI